MKPRRFDTGANVSRQIFSRESTSGALRGWHFGTDDPSSVELDVATVDGVREIAAPVAVNAWSHVAVIYDGSMRVFVNGTLANTVAGPHVLAPAPNGVARLGCKTPNDKRFDGVVDDLRIYARVLTEAEITSLAQP